MKTILTKQGMHTLLCVLLFALSVFLIVQLFPRQGTFEYHYQVNKPWSYELVTAPFDFPIYKDKIEVLQERKEALASFEPYFKVDEKVAVKELDLLNRNLDTLSHVPSEYKWYLKDVLKYIYDNGIIHLHNLDSLKANEQTGIVVIYPNQLAEKKAINSLFTTKTAYQYILSNRPSWMDENVLKSFNINYYLSENLNYDKELSDKYKIDLLKQVSLTNGMVQAGERIVDKGEIVTHRTAAQLNSLKIELNKQKGTADQYDFMWLGQVILATSLMTLLFLYIYLFRMHIYENIKSVLFILLMIVLMSAFAALTFRFGFPVFVVPFALVAILVRIFFDSRTALFAHIITVLQISISVPDSFGFVLLQLTAGMSVISSLKDLTQRSQLARTAFIVFISYTVMYVSYILLTMGEWTFIEWTTILVFAINALLLLFSYGFIFIFEKLFGFLSNVSLVELSNVNSELMQRYSDVAPGSFQHSMQVANLAAEAAKKINGNALLIRIGALYHDIGKMANPSYFTENQLTGNNPLDMLDYQQAAHIIISHVDEGVKIAQKNKIPEKIIDFIRTHHGTGMPKYFYNAFKNKYPEAVFDESVFHYKGPSPKTKEQAVLMMADAVEASSKSLNSYSDTTINQLVDDIVGRQIADGLLKDAKITFCDVETVKAVFKEKLKTIYHTRVQYPDLEN